MLRRIAVMFAAFAMLFGVLTSIGAAAQSNGTSISSLLGTSCYLCWGAARDTGERYDCRAMADPSDAGRSAANPIT